MDWAWSILGVETHPRYRLTLQAAASRLATSWLAPELSAQLAIAPFTVGKADDEREALGVIEPGAGANRLDLPRS